MVQLSGCGVAQLLGCGVAQLEGAAWLCWGRVQRGSVFGCGVAQLSGWGVAQLLGCDEETRAELSECYE